MKKIVAACIFVACVYLLKVSVSENSMKEITESRYQSTGMFSSSKYKYGDLFGLTYLKDFMLKEDRFPNKPLNIKKNPENLSLHIISDSYVFGPFADKKEYFSRARNLKFYPWKDKNWELPKLDSNLINIAIVEVIERERAYVLNLDNIKSRLSINNENGKVVVSQQQQQHFFLLKAINTTQQFFKFIGSIFYHKNIDTHLEFVLFDFEFLLPFKLWKADLNYHVFNRINSDVVLSKDGKNLYVKSTIDKNSPGSSFREIDNKEIENQVFQMNEISRYLKLMGFQKVLFTLIPNPVSVLKTELQPMNEFVNRVQNNPKLQVEFLDLNKELSKNPDFYFCRSDTHWNSNGIDLWIYNVNNYLNSIPQ
ncbi:MAG: hypothetical protein ACKOWQ_10055 [Aquirufa sp.]